MNVTDARASKVMESKIGGGSDDDARVHANTTLGNWKTRIVDGRRCVKVMAQRLRSFELTVDDWLILDVIAKHGGITMSRIAEETVLPAATLSRLVDRLTDEALLYRKANPFDRRQIQVYVSQRGMHLLEKVADDLEGE